MTISATFFVKILLVLVCAAGLFRLLPKVGGRKAAALTVCCAVLVSGVLAQKAAGSVPQLTDLVTVTATGEKNPAAAGNDISLLGYTVDGVDHPVDNAVEGKWFWYGESMMWRTEYSANRPADVTREARFAVPVGKERTLNFTSHEWRGIVKVEYEGEEQTVDLYSAKNTTRQISIAASDSSRVLLNRVRPLAAFAAVLFALSGIMAVALCRWQKDPVNAEVWLDRHFWIVYVGIAAASLTFMIAYSDKEGFWSAELHELWAFGRAEPILKTLFKTHSTYYPSLLFGSVAAVWYDLAPYGEKYLLLPFEIVTACGGIFAALAAEKMANRRVGLAAAVFSAFAYPILYECGYEIRTYAFLYLCAAILFYVFAQKTVAQMESGKPVLKFEILFGLAVFLCAANHVFGMFLSCFLFCADAVMFFRKKYKWTFMLSYVGGAILFLPWVYNVFASNIMSSSQTWQPAPTIAGVVDLIEFLAGDTALSILLFVFGVVYILVCALGDWPETMPAKFLPMTLIWVIFGCIAFLFCYGKFINQDATMWINRYFVILFPATAAVCGIAADTILSLCSKKNIRITASVLLAASFISASCGALIADVSVERQMYRASAEWINAQSIYRDDAAVVFAGFSSDMKGWRDYYLRQQGQRDSIDVITQDGIQSETLAKYNTIYLQYEYRALNAEMKKILEEQFDLKETHENVKIKTYVRKAAS